MSDFWGFGGYQRPAEGYFSAEHLIFVSTLMAIMIAAAVFLGLRNRKRSDREKNLVLVISAILIDLIEIIKIVVICLRSDDPLTWTRLLPLFLCSIQLITIPLAAFSRGRIREASLDFVFIFGLLGAVLGTYGAGQNYSAYPVFSLDNVASGLTHSISGFCALYIVIAGLESMKRKNIGITFSILTGFCAAALIANLSIPGKYNYMFLMAGDGTPYDILYNLVGGNPVIYPMLVILLFFIYISVFYYAYFLITNKISKEKGQKNEQNT